MSGHSGHHAHQLPAHHSGDNGQKKTLSGSAFYTCPMHPEIRQPGPGSCPICGMALEPEQVTGEDTGPSAELIDMTRRFWIGLVLSVPVLVLEMGGHLFGLDHLIRPQLSNWVQMGFATPVILWAGWPNSRNKRGILKS